MTGKELKAMRIKAGMAHDSLARQTTLTRRRLVVLELGRGKADDWEIDLIRYVMKKKGVWHE